MFRLADLKMALRALTRDRLRTSLTTLGIAIGIAAVIITVALGQGASGQVQAQLDALPKAPFTETPHGEAHIETYTVMHGRNGPEFAVVFGRLHEGGERFIANLPDDPTGLWALQNHESIGRAGRVHRADEGRNVFVPN